MFCWMDHTKNIDENGYTLPHLSHILESKLNFLYLNAKTVIKQNFKILLHHLPTSNFI